MNREAFEHIVITNETAKLRDVVLIGGGHAHALVLKAWGRNPPPSTRLTVINPDPKAPYTGMLPGFVAGHYGADEISIDLVRLAEFAGARLILGHATGLDPKAEMISLTGGPPIAFDVASINVGIASGGIDIASDGRDVFGAKPMGRFVNGWAKYVEAVSKGAASPHAAVIGGGIGGVELALAITHRLNTIAPAHTAVQVGLIEAGPTLLPRESASLRSTLNTALLKAKITLYLDTKAVSAFADGINLSNGDFLPANFIAAAAGAIAPNWLGTTGLRLDNGYVVIDDTLRACGHDSIFAVGDCATITGARRPKAGVYAVRQAPVLFANLAATLDRRPLRQFRPQRDYLKIVSLGGKNAVASKWDIAAHLPGIWTWKNRIDRAFMSGLSGP